MTQWQHVDFKYVFYHWQWTQIFFKSFICFLLSTESKCIDQWDRDHTSEESFILSYFIDALSLWCTDTCMNAGYY